MKTVTQSGTATLRLLFDKPGFEANLGLDGPIRVWTREAETLDIMREISALKIEPGTNIAMRTVAWAYGPDSSVRIVSSVGKYILANALRSLYLRGISHVVITEYDCKMEGHTCSDMSVTHIIYPLTEEHRRLVRPTLVPLQ